jgi:hypothetical protein
LAFPFHLERTLDYNNAPSWLLVSASTIVNILVEIYII